MALVKSRAIILRTYKLGETSKVVVCYTRDYGKVRLVAKGGRTGGTRFGAALEPMMVSGVLFYLREGRDLLLVSKAEIVRDFPELRRDLERMAFAGAVLEVADRLLAEREGDPCVFDLIEGALGDLATGAPDLLDAAFWSFELSLASALGYGPELDRCTVCGRGAAPAPAFSARRGGVVCGRCSADRSGGETVSGPAAALLIEAGRGLVGPSGASNSAVRDEVGETIVRFLEAHTGTRLRLKSLDFLAQVRRAQDPSPTAPRGRRASQVSEDP